EELRPPAVVFCCHACCALTGGRQTLCGPSSIHRKRQSKRACRHRFAVAMEQNAGDVTEDRQPTASQAVMLTPFQNFTSWLAALTLQFSHNHPCVVRWNGPS